MDEPKKRRAGRKHIPIDWAVVETMCKAMAPATDIAAALGISTDTLLTACQREHKVEFSAYRAKHMASTRHRLRALQIREANGYEYKETEQIFGKDGKLVRKIIHDKKREPSNLMLIWLGKQYLKQSDRPEDIDDENDHYRVLGDTPDGMDAADLVD